MKPLIDHHTADRIAALRQMQGLSFSIPPGHTAYRQSDFEQSKLWRYGLALALVVILLALFEPDPSSAPPAHAPAEQSATHAIHSTV